MFLSSTSQQNEEQSNVANLVMEKDLKHLCQLIEMKDGGPTWIQMMDHSIPGMRYQAWRRHPKVKFLFLKRRAKKSRVGTLTWSQLYQKKKA